MLLLLCSTLPTIDIHEVKDQLIRSFALRFLPLVVVGSLLLALTALPLIARSEGGGYSGFATAHCGKPPAFR